MRKGKKNPQKKYKRELIHNRMNAVPGEHDLVFVLDNLKRTYNVSIAASLGVYEYLRQNYLL